MNYFQNACKLFVKSHNSVLFSTVCFRYADRLNTSCADKKAVIQCQLGQSRIFIILGALDFIFQARIETAQLRKIKRSLIFGKWLIILLRTATHASLCYSGLQPKIQIYNRILYHLGSLYLQLFSTPLFHDLEVVCIYIYVYINMTLPYPGRIQCFTLHTVCKHTAKIGCFAHQTLSLLDDFQRSMQVKMCTILKVFSFTIPIT